MIGSFNALMIFLGRGFLSIMVGVAGHRKDLSLCEKVRRKQGALFDLDFLSYSNLPPPLPLLSSLFPLVIKHSSLIFAVAIYYWARSKDALLLCLTFIFDPETNS